MRRRRSGPLWVALAGAIAVAAGAALYATDAWHRLELISVDVRFDARGGQTPPQDIVVVGIDDTTFSDYTFVPYPLPRGLHARVIRRLVRAGARVIAYDIQFTEPSSSGRDDLALLDAVELARGKIVLATTETDGFGGTRVLGGDETLHDVGARAGNSIVPADANGVIRRMPYEVDKLMSFPFVAAELAAGRTIEPESLPEASPWIAFHGPPGTLKSYSFSRVERGRVPPAAFRDKIVVVGAVAPSLQDVSATSTSGDELMSGPEIQSEAISTILRGFPLRAPADWLGWVLTLGLGAIPVLAGLRFKPLPALLVGVTAGLLFAAGVYVAFLEGWIVPLVGPLATLALSAVTVLAVGGVQEAMERRRVRDTFARFVPERVVDQVLEHADEDLRLGGVRRECTVLFSDLRGFTSFGEDRSPDEVISFLNDYLTEMSDAILDRGGTLISYMGDGIMAVFGAPLDQPDHRDRALATARDMLERLERFNLESNGDFRMGIGINTGFAMCGNVGSERRLEYTAIGDTTNTASRLESMTKDTGFAVFVADSTRAGLADPPPDLEFVDDLAVRGRRSTLRIWGLRERCARPPGGLPSALDVRMLATRLQAVPFFSMLDQSQLELVARHTESLEVAAGEVLTREGDPGWEFFVIEAGTADVTIDGKLRRQLGPGDFFGELALVEEERRTATVTATSAMRLILITRESFRAMDRTMPAIHGAVQAAIEQRGVSTR